MAERWKPIKDFEGLYQISDSGIVKSNNGLIRKQFLSHNGYSRITLYKNNKQKKYQVHRLVAEAFIENPDNKPQINHIDGDKTNNQSLNLEWCTNKENINHADKTGLRNIRGEHSKVSKLTDLHVYYILYWLSLNYTHRSIAKAFNVSKSTITMIKNKQIWNHIELTDFLNKGKEIHILR